MAERSEYWRRITGGQPSYEEAAPKAPFQIQIAPPGSGIYEDTADVLRFLKRHAGNVADRFSRYQSGVQADAAARRGAYERTVADYRDRPGYFTSPNYAEEMARRDARQVLPAGAVSGDYGGDTPAPPVAPSPQMLMEDDLPAVPRVPDSESIGDVPQPVGVSNPPAQSDKGSSRAQVGGDVMPSGERIAATSIRDPVVAATNAALAVDTEKDMASAYEKAAEAARARMAAILGNVKTAGISDRDKWLSLALGGARMAASRNPTFFGAAGEGAEAGIGHFMQADERARRAALQQAQQEIGAETAAESAGARAENRVIRREDIKARSQDRLDQLEARKADIKARLEDRALDREARAQSEREYRNIQLEIAKLRDTTTQRGQDMRLEAAKERARAAGAKSFHEQSWIEYARGRGLVPDSPEGDIQALGMIRPSKEADLTRTRGNIAATIYKGMAGDLLDKRSDAEKRAAALAAAEQFVGAPAAKPPVGAAPAPTAPPPAAPGTVRRYNPATGKLE